jgi:hypothetical protein
MQKRLIIIVAMLIVGIVGLVVTSGMMRRAYFAQSAYGFRKNTSTSNSRGLNIDQAAETVEGYLRAREDPDLKLAEVMEFTNQFYAEVEEESTGIHAFELLVNKNTGGISPEPGPNMMWNEKYGHMRGGMMGGGRWRWDRQGAAREMSIPPEKALEYAQVYLDKRMPGTKVTDEVDTFYGYYTIHVLKNGEIFGMLGVNGYSGQVWYHNWHDRFIQLKKFEEQK